eukprot:gene12341-biopygen12471
MYDGWRMYDGRTMYNGCMMYDGWMVDYGRMMYDGARLLPSPINTICVPGVHVRWGPERGAKAGVFGSLASICGKVCHWQTRGFWLMSRPKMSNPRLPFQPTCLGLVPANRAQNFEKRMPSLEKRAPRRWRILGGWGVLGDGAHPLAMYVNTGNMFVPWNSTGSVQWSWKNTRLFRACPVDVEKTCSPVPENLFPGLLSRLLLGGLALDVVRNPRPLKEIFFASARRRCCCWGPPRTGRRRSLRCVLLSFANALHERNRLPYLTNNDHRAKGVILSLSCGPLVLFLLGGCKNPEWFHYSGRSTHITTPTTPPCAHSIFGDARTKVKDSTKDKGLLLYCQFDGCEYSATASRVFCTRVSLLGQRGGRVCPSVLRAACTPARVFGQRYSRLSSQLCNCCGHARPRTAALLGHDCGICRREGRQVGRQEKDPRERVWVVVG